MFAHQLTAHARVQTVGADQHVGAVRAAIVELQLDFVSDLAKAHALRIHVQGVGLESAHRIHQHLVKVGTVHHVVGRTVARHRLRAQVEQRNGLAGGPDPHFLGGGFHAPFRQLLAQSERLQDAHAIGAELHTRANLFEFLCLLEDGNVHASPQHGQGGCQAADAAT